MPMTTNATASKNDTVATPTEGYIIAEIANPMAITPTPNCKSLRRTKAFDLILSLLPYIYLTGMI